MSKRTTIRIPDDLYGELLTLAIQEQRTVSNLVILLLRESLPKRKIDSRIDSSDKQKAPDANAPKAS